MSPLLTVEAQMRECRRSAVHLEMRDGYTLKDPMLDAWRTGHRENTKQPNEHWRPWLDLVAETQKRGVQIRRARIVSEPISDYIRYEYDLTHVNVAYGEEVRWLPRRQATAIPLPGNDFWLFDGNTLLVNHFSGDGGPTEKELIAVPSVIGLCAAAFETVWELAIPHADYRPL